MWKIKKKEYICLDQKISFHVIPTMPHTELLEVLILHYWDFYYRLEIFKGSLTTI